MVAPPKIIQDPGKALETQVCSGYRSKSALVFIELKTGFADNGPADIGHAVRSKSGRTIFFNGKAFKQSTRRSSGNQFDAELFSGHTILVA